MSVTFVLLITLLIAAASLLIALLIVRIRQGYPQIVNPAQNQQFRRGHTLMLGTAATIWIAALGILVTQWIAGAAPADSALVGEQLSEEAAVDQAPIAPADIAEEMPVTTAAELPPVEPPPDAAPPEPAPVHTTAVPPEPPKPGPAPEPARAPAPAPKPAAPRPLIVDTGSDLALQVRDQPDGNSIGRVRNGELVEPLPAPTQIADGRPWIRIRTKAGLEGWVVRASVKPAGAASN